MARPRFGRDMGYEQLQFFLAHQEATPALRALAPFLKSLCTSNHMIEMAKHGLEMERLCTAALTDDASMGLVELELIIAQLLRIESAADASDDKAAKKAKHQTARHEREAQRAPPSAPKEKKEVVGEKPPPVIHRSLADIQAIHKANAISRAAAAARKPREDLERDGWTTTYTVAAESKWGVPGSEVHTYLVSYGTEHFNAVLKEFGLSGTYDGEKNTVTITFPGKVLKEFFSKVLDGPGNKTLNPKMPVISTEFSLTIFSIFLPDC